MTDLTEHGGLQAADLGQVILSRNETDSLCMKAARGVGFSWGLAEEAGFAAAWLAARGIDGATPLLTLLSRKLQRSSDVGMPKPAPGYWQSLGQGPLCPIQLGAALTDEAQLQGGPFSRDTRLDPIEIPLLLLPFLSRAARICQRHLAIDWPGGHLQITPEGAVCGVDVVSWAGSNVFAITIKTSLSEQTKTLPSERISLPSILVSTLNGLRTLAMRTTVPATNASRKGAGSATTDND